MKEHIVIDMVRAKRRIMPRLGGKKLYHLLSEDLEEAGKIGRDKFFQLLRRNGLLVKRKRSSIKTTQSYHHFHKWNNLLKGVELTRSNQAWGSDITYLRTVEGFVYLFLITDLYSRKIVGWSLSRSLSIEGGLEALHFALGKRKKNNKALIHHSDRGIQYCSKTYVDTLQSRGVSISMTEENHCYENSKAERVNGILKDEFYLNSTFLNFEQAFKTVRSAINIYNEHRPHWSLQLKTPSHVHEQIVA
jgi:Transposase and inactivated derivatives